MLEEAVENMINVHVNTRMQIIVQNFCVHATLIVARQESWHKTTSANATTGRMHFLKLYDEIESCYFNFASRNIVSYFGCDVFTFPIVLIAV